MCLPYVKQELGQGSQGWDEIVGVSCAWPGAGLDPHGSKSGYFMIPFPHCYICGKKVLHWSLFISADSCVCVVPATLSCHQTSQVQDCFSWWSGSAWSLGLSRLPHFSSVETHLLKTTGAQKNLRNPFWKSKSALSAHSLMFQVALTHEGWPPSQRAILTQNPSAPNLPFLLLLLWEPYPL